VEPGRHLTTIKQWTGWYATTIRLWPRAGVSPRGAGTKEVNLEGRHQGEGAVDLIRGRTPKGKLIHLNVSMVCRMPR